MTIRQEISFLADQIHPMDDKELMHKLFVLQWIDRGADIFRIKKPATPDPHLVVYFTPYDEQRQKVLLGHHKKADLWLPPGGHVEVNEHPKEAAKREHQEELFTEAEFLLEDPLFLTVGKTTNDLISHTDVTFWFVVKGDSSKQCRFEEEEFFNVKWFDLDGDFSKKVDPNFSRFIKKLKTRWLTIPS